MKIQPVTIWANGQEQQADGFILTISFDNLINAASFSYSLVKTSENENEGRNLQNGNININGQDYLDWDASPSANEWAYNWAAAQLNLTIIEAPIVEESIIEEIIAETKTAK